MSECGEVIKKYRTNSPSTKIKKKFLIKKILSPSWFWCEEPIKNIAIIILSLPVMTQIIFLCLPPIILKELCFKLMYS